MHFLPPVETKYYNVMIDGRNVFDQQVKNYNIQNTANDEGDGYATGC